jgi:predicted amidohydrolase
MSGMAVTRLAAVAAHFGRDIDRALVKIEGIVEDAREAGVSLLVLPDATLGGYLADMEHPDPAAMPPAVSLDGPELRKVAQLAGDMVICVGFTEEVPGDSGILRYNTAVALSGDGVLGTHRKVHQPLGESQVYSPGDAFEAFDTPVGRMGMLIDYDKTFPEAARSLALDGAMVIACLSAWPASVTDRAERLQHDRQSRLFDLYDCARAAENQVIVVSSNQTGVTGGLRFLGQAKVVGPGGDVLARTGSRGALAVAAVDVQYEIARARRVLHHLDERVLDSYHSALTRTIAQH